MIDPTVLPAFLVAVLLVVVAPGPDNTYIAAVALDRGPRAGVVSAFGMSIGMLVHVALAAAGLAVLLRSAPWTLTAVQLGGGGYLGWLAVSTFRDRRRAAAHGDSPTEGRLLRRAVLTNLTNPKVIVFFAAFLPQFARGGSGPFALRLGTLGVLFLLVGLLSDCVIGLCVGRLGRAITPGGRAGSVLSTVAAATFAALAVLLVGEAVTA
jgi:threonine/homoserine/homoserine lactone efflux protein